MLTHAEVKSPLGGEDKLLLFFVVYSYGKKRDGGWETVGGENGGIRVVKLECTRGDVRLQWKGSQCTATLTYLLLQLPFAMSSLILMRYQVALPLHLEHL